MVTYMNDQNIQTLDDVHAFLEGATEIEFAIQDKGAVSARWLVFSVTTQGRMNGFSD